jgi:hypothetical protein
MTYVLIYQSTLDSMSKPSTFSFLEILFLLYKNFLRYTIFFTVMDICIYTFVYIDIHTYPYILQFIIFLVVTIMILIIVIFAVITIIVIIISMSFFIFIRNQPKKSLNLLYKNTPFFLPTKRKITIPLPWQH